MKKIGVILLTIALLAVSIIPLNLVFATPGDIQVLYKCAETNSSINTLRPYIQIKNTSTTAINLADVKVRYWYTQDGTQAQSFVCDWAQIGASNVTGYLVNTSPATANADNYLEIGFTSSAGTLAPGASTGEIQIRIYKSDWSNYNQSNDYSFAPTVTSYGENTKVTGYVSGVPAYGTPPVYKLNLSLSAHGYPTASGLGSVSASPADIYGNTAGNQTLYYTPGSQVQLTVICYDNNYYFGGWSGSLTGTKNPETIVMDSDKTAAGLLVEGLNGPTTPPTITPTPTPPSPTDSYPTPTPTARPTIPPVFRLITQPATDITATSATLNATIEITEGNPSADIYYWEASDPSVRYCAVLASFYVGPGTFSFSAPATTGLKPATQYEFVATAAEGQVGGTNGSVMSFTTLEDSTPSPTPMPTPTVMPTAYKLTINGSMYGSVSASPADIYGNTSDDQPLYYTPGTQVQLTASTGVGGFAFYGWDGDLTGSKNPETITVDSDKTVDVYFVEGHPGPTVTPTPTPTTTPPPQKNLTVALQTSQMGSVIIMPGTIRVGMTSTYSFPEGTVLTLQAGAFTQYGYYFSGWSGSVSSSASTITVTMDGDKYETAYFGYHSPTPTPAGPTPTPTSTSTPTPTPSGPSGIKVQFFNGNTTATTNTVYPDFKLVNVGSTSINLADVKLRYYFTNDGAQANNFACDYSTVGSGNVTGTFATIAKTNADRYLEVSFSSSAGSLAGGASAEVKGRVWKSDWSNFTQTNDYSFNSTATNYEDWSKVTGYISGVLNWGVEP